MRLHPIISQLLERAYGALEKVKQSVARSAPVQRIRTFAEQHDGESLVIQSATTAALDSLDHTTASALEYIVFLDAALSGNDAIASFRLDRIRERGPFIQLGQSKGVWMLDEHMIRRLRELNISSETLTRIVPYLRMNDQQSAAQIQWEHLLPKHGYRVLPSIATFKMPPFPLKSEREYHVYLADPDTVKTTTHLSDKSSDDRLDIIVQRFYEEIEGMGDATNTITLWSFAAMQTIAQAEGILSSLEVYPVAQKLREALSVDTFGASKELEEFLVLLEAYGVRRSDVLHADRSSENDFHTRVRSSSQASRLVRFSNEQDDSYLRENVSFADFDTCFRRTTPMFQFVCLYHKLPYVVKQNTVAGVEARIRPIEVVPQDVARGRYVSLLRSFELNPDAYDLGVEELVYLTRNAHTTRLRFPHMQQSAVAHARSLGAHIGDESDTFSKIMHDAFTQLAPSFCTRLEKVLNLD